MNDFAGLHMKNFFTGSLPLYASSSHLCKPLSILLST